LDQPIFCDSVGDSNHTSTSLGMESISLLVF
jgi:hypothetical protein